MTNLPQSKYSRILISKRNLFFTFEELFVNIFLGFYVASPVEFGMVP